MSRRLLCTALALLAPCGAAWAQDAAAPAAPAEARPAPPAAAATAAPSAEAGRRTYTSYCARCHGIRLVSTGSAFFDLRTFPKDDKPRFVESVTKGRRAMPAWEDTLKPEQIESIWLYIGEVNGW